MFEQTMGAVVAAVNDSAIVTGAILVAFAGLWAVAILFGSRLINRLASAPVPRLDPRKFLDGRMPKLTVIVAARDEELAIGERIDNLFAQHDPGGGLEVLVVCDGCQDGTAHVARQRQANVPAGFTLNVVELLVNRGKEEAVAVAVEHAQGDMLALTDATTHWEPNVATLLVEGLMQDGVGAVSGRVLYRSRQSGVASGFSVYQKMVVAQRRNGGKSGLQTSTSGACSAAWARLFRRYMGYMNSDLQLLLLAAEDGLATAYVNDAVAWEEPRTSLQEELRARKRIARLCLLSLVPLFGRLFAARSWWLIAQFVVSKLTRWFVWVPALAAVLGLLLLSLGSLPWLAVAARISLVGLWMVALVGAIRLRDRLRGGGKIIAAAGYLMLAMEATSSALWQVLRGQTSLAWQPDRVSVQAETIR